MTAQYNKLQQITKCCMAKMAKACECRDKCMTVPDKFCGLREMAVE